MINILTNRLGLPQSIVKAVLNDPYKGGGDISVTKLISPPYQRRLRREHGTRDDVADRIWSLIGQVGHSILERCKPENGLAEVRLFMDHLGWTISGQFDLLEDGVLSDFKFTSVWAAAGKIEWEQQLNLLRVLCYERLIDTCDARYEVNKLQIIAIYRDWQKSRVSEGYPSSQVEVIPIPMWSYDDAVAFLTDRVLAHQHPDPEPCTDAERWKTDDVYAVMRPNAKKAVRLFPTEQLATEFLASMPDRKKEWVEKRAGEYRRCAAYCDVAHACPVWKRHVEEAPF